MYTYLIGASVGDKVNVFVGLSVGSNDGGKVKSSMLQLVSAKHCSPLSHSSSDPLGHHRGRLPFLHDADATVQLAPQNRKFLGSS